MGIKRAVSVIVAAQGAGGKVSNILETVTDGNPPDKI